MSGRICHCCGDPANKFLNGIPLCEDCWDELKNGIIKDQNITFFGGGICTPEDDSSPGNQNAIREYEDRFDDK